MKKERLIEFDLMRGIAFIFIVLQHTIGGFSFRSDISTNDLFISKFLYTISEIATPLFICLTGIVLLYTYYDEFNIKSFYIKKLKFLVLPFVMWSLFIILYKEEPIDKNILLTIFTGNSQYHLWYMGMILRIYLYFPLILVLTKFVNKQKIYIKTLSFLFFILGYWFVLNHYEILDIIKNFLFENPTELQSSLINITPLFYYFYFVIGVYIISNYNTFKHFAIRYKYIIIMLYALAFIYYYYIELSSSIGDPFPFIKSYTIMSIFYRSISILFLYIVSYYIVKKFRYIRNILIFISKYSFSAYLIHILVIEASTRYISNSLSIIPSIEYLVIGVIVSTLICFLLNYIPYSEYFIGNKSKFDKNKLIKIVKEFKLIIDCIINKQNDYISK